MALQEVVKKQLLLLLLVLCTCSFSLAGIIVLNGLTHENVAQPGEKYRGTIQIQNTAEKEKSVRVYLRDYRFSYT
ncbi:MAG: hypothetical protein J7L95_00630, partial [Prolixibacteraceae bacterium]|nr:hypothetical protein [Prolixibacteraceae bacterium]